MQLTATYMKPIIKRGLIMMTNPLILLGGAGGGRTPDLLTASHFPLSFLTSLNKDKLLKLLIISLADFFYFVRF